MNHFFRSTTRLLFFAMGIFGLTLLSSCGQKPALPQNEDNLSRAVSLFEAGNKAKQQNADSALSIYLNALNTIEQADRTDTSEIVRGFIYARISSVKFEQSVYEEAKKYDSLAYNIALNYDHSGLKALIYNTRGLLNYVTGNYDEAVYNYNFAIKYATQANDLLSLAKIYTNLGIIGYFKGNIDTAIANFNYTLQIAHKLSDSVLLAGCYNNMAIIFYNFGVYDSSGVYYHKALDLSTQAGSIDGIAFYTQNVGNVYFVKADYANAIEYYQKALELNTNMNNKPGMARSFQSLGETYMNIGNYEKAAGFFVESIKIKEKLGDKEGMVITLISLGNLNYQQSDYDSAKEHYARALALSAEMENQLKMATLYHLMANIWSAQNEPDSALNYQTKALGIFTRLENPDGLSNTYHSLGNVYALLNQHSKALECFNKALELKTTLGDSANCSFIHCNISEVYSQMGKPYLASAISHAGIAEKTAGLIHHLPAQVAVCKAFAKAYSAQNNYAKAYYWLEKYKVLDDSLQNIQKAERIANIEIGWKTEKKQHQIEQLQSEKAYQDKVIRAQSQTAHRNKAIIIILLVTLVLIVLLGISLTTIVKRRRKINYQKQLAENAKVRIVSLRNRFSPHFVFNALASIKGSTHEPEKLQAKITDLTFLIRNTLEHIDQILVPIGNELAVVRSYVNIFIGKIPGKVDFQIEMGEGVDKNQLIPSMLIQIPVENALKHGLMPLESELKSLNIKLSKSADFTHIEITDNGMGLNHHVPSNGTGTGLKTLMQTIHLINNINDKKITFELFNIETLEPNKKGVKVQILVPEALNYPN